MGSTDIKLVTWDVDGTLFSFGQLSKALLRLSPVRFRQRGLIPMLGDLREVWRFHRTVERQRSTTVVVENDLQRFAEIEAEESRALSAALARIRPRGQVLELLMQFQRDGIVQVAVSDFECDYKIAALGLTRFFAGTYSCRGLGFWKPSPVPLERVQRDFGISPRHHLHIGDRPGTDGEASARAGCSFVKIQDLEAKMLGQTHADFDSAGLRRPERARRTDRRGGGAGQTTTHVVPADR